jgi:hypothetical protein
MLVILVLQHATQYTSSDLFADLLSDAGLFIIFAALVIGAIFKLLYYYRSPYGSPYRFWGGVLSLALLGFWIILRNVEK